MSVVTNAKLGFRFDSSAIRAYLSGKGIQLTILINFLSQKMIDFPLRVHILGNTLKKVVDRALVLCRLR